MDISQWIEQMAFKQEAGFCYLAEKNLDWEASWQKELVAAYQVPHDEERDAHTEDIGTSSHQQILINLGNGHPSQTGVHRSRTWPVYLLAPKSADLQPDLHGFWHD